MRLRVVFPALLQPEGGPACCTKQHALVRGHTVRQGICCRPLGGTAAPPRPRRPPELIDEMQPGTRNFEKHDLLYKDLGVDIG